MENLDTFLDKIASVDVNHIEPFDETVDVGVFIGCGSWPAAGEPLPANRLLMNNKGTAPRFGRGFSSVTRLMVAPPPGFFEGWNLWTGRPIDPQAALDRMVLVVEDASPDSVFGVLLLLASLYGLEPANFPAAWIDAVDLWEREGVADDPRTSWCPLQSALAHSQFPVAAKMTETGLRKAWTDSLRFAAYCLRQQLSPHAIADLPDCKEWRNARMALDQEEQVYLNWLPHGTALQLSLPLAYASDRQMLIDALVFTEDQSTGSAKVYYRNDKTNAPLKQGFTLAAHHRPAEQGTGNDFTIAVDPRRGVQLRDLWHELERRENEAWARAGEARPDNDIRPLVGVENRWNQPWYITPDATLIGAPRRISTHQLGTKLSWHEVLDAIWTVYNPLRDVQVCPPGSDTAVPLLTLPPEDLSTATADREPVEHHRRFLFARWPKSSSPTSGLGPRSLSDAAIVPRIFAAMINRGSSHRQISLEDLPAPGSWERFPLSAGFCVVTGHGLFVLDDWTADQLDHPAIAAAFHQVAALDHELCRLDLDVIRGLMQDIKPLVAHADKGRGRRAAAARPKHLAAEVSKALRDVVTIGARLSELRSRAGLPPNPDARIIHDALDRRWGVERQMKSLEEEVRSVETSLRSLDELRSQGVIRFATVFAFPVVLATGLFDPASKAIWWLLGRLGESAAGAPAEAPVWLPLLSFAVIALATGAVMQWWQSRTA